MKRSLLLALLVAALASPALAQCKDTLRAMSPSLIGLSLCPGTPVPAEGDTLVIAAGGGEFEATVTSSQSTLGTQLVNSEVAEPAKAQENMLLLVGVATATVTVEDADPFPVDVLQDPTAIAQSYSRYEWSLGPATEGASSDEAEGDGGGDGETGGEDEPADEAGALRLRFTGGYSRAGLFGAMKKSRLHTKASLAIDTTDQDSPDFVDNNQATLGVGFTNLSFGRLLAHGSARLEGQVERGFHHDVQNVDAVVSVSGWVPLFRSLTLLSREGEFIAAPLSFTASYGFRDHDQGDESTNGRVLEASALYHLFLFDQYQVSLSATWTRNDLDAMPADLPGTQRLYKATIAYLDPDNGFKVLTSIEDGSAGVMLREVRQYFVGIALSRLAFGGTGG